MTTDSSKATPRPWYATRRGADTYITEAWGDCEIGIMFKEADGALAVRTVNRDPAFDAMKEALEEIERKAHAHNRGGELGMGVRDDIRAIARAALRLANGEPQ